MTPFTDQAHRYPSKYIPLNGKLQLKYSILHTGWAHWSGNGPTKQWLLRQIHFLKPHLKTKLINYTAVTCRLMNAGKNRSIQALLLWLETLDRSPAYSLDCGPRYLVSLQTTALSGYLPLLSVPPDLRGEVCICYNLQIGSWSRTGGFPCSINSEVLKETYNKMLLC